MEYWGHHTQLREFWGHLNSGVSVRSLTWVKRRTTSRGSMLRCHVVNVRGREPEPSAQGERKGTSLNSYSLAPKPLASSVYVRVPEAHCPHKRPISMTSIFPSRGGGLGGTGRHGNRSRTAGSSVCSPATGWGQSEPVSGVAGSASGGPTWAGWEHAWWALWDCR